LREVWSAMRKPSAWFSTRESLITRVNDHIVALRCPDCWYSWSVGVKFARNGQVASYLTGVRRTTVVTIGVGISGLYEEPRAVFHHSALAQGAWPDCRLVMRSTESWSQHSYRLMDAMDALDTQRTSRRFMRVRSCRYWRSRFLHRHVWRPGEEATLGQDR